MDMNLFIVHQKCLLAKACDLPPKNWTNPKVSHCNRFIDTWWWVNFLSNDFTVDSLARKALRNPSPRRENGNCKKGQVVLWPEGRGMQVLALAPKYPRQARQGQSRGAL